MGCAHDGMIHEEICKRFIYPHDPDNGEWEIVFRVETCKVCGERITDEPAAEASGDAANVN